MSTRPDRCPKHRLILAALFVGLAALVQAQQPSFQPGQSWQRFQFPDGSGSVAVPQAWRINSAQRASTEMQGPYGEGVALGVTFAVGPAQFAQPGVPAGPYLPPPQAFAWISDLFAQQGNQAPTQTRIVEVQPTAALTQNAQAAYLLADQMRQGRHYRAFALVNTANLGNGYWQYYMTMVTAPADVFPRALPFMLEIWHSWTMSAGEMTRRTAAAIGIMKETNAIMQQTAEGRRLKDWHQYQTGLTLSGRWVLEDTHTGQRLECTSEEINYLMSAFPGRFRNLGSSEIRSPGAANCQPLPHRR